MPSVNLNPYRGPLGPTTFTVMTLNLWGANHWELRRDGVEALMTVRLPDVLCVQELTPNARAVIDAALAGHNRGDGAQPGWASAGNIWWREGLFELVSEGFEEIDELGDDRGLFWVRLAPRADLEQQIIVGTAHLSWQGYPPELADLRNRRVPQVGQIADHLDRLAEDGPVIFAGDINDISPAQFALAERGFCDCWAALGQHTPATSPVPASLSLGGVWEVSKQLVRVASGFDVQFSRGPIRVRGAEVVEFFHNGCVVSDHFPVQVTYTLGRL